jgi:phosphopantothenoylcysteine decarboxylase / phosphopantothenate---cysteine ligase
MNKEMWLNEITQVNTNNLIKRGIKFFGPASGELACGEIGIGKMLEPLVIVEMLANTWVEPLFRGKKIIITAGPTMEAIDPVRFLSNKSSGKMGYAIATAAANYGAEVLLISGPTPLNAPDKVKVISVTTGNQMLSEVMKNIEKCAIFISTAAICDYQNKNVNLQKIKKENDQLQLNLIKTPDILSQVASLENPPFTVGFAAETENLVTNAQEKLKKKKIDLIAANLVNDDLGFSQDENALTLIKKNGEIFELSKKDKKNLAYELLEFIAKNF